VEQGHGVSTDWWTLLADEETPELQWPNSIVVFDRMRRQDAQVRSVIRAVTMPVQQAKWRLNQGEASDEVTQFVAANLGLPIVGQSDSPPPVPRERDRFDWNQHVAWALLCTVYGHSYFEQVYRYDEGTNRLHLRKLAPRWPKTIAKINVAPDGGLVSIVQRPLVGLPATDARRSAEPVELTVDRLVAYVYDREGGNWQGQSLLRSAYKHWLLKDQALRTWAQTIERNGMGVPHYTASEEEESLDAGTRLARSYRAGAAAGGAGPHGSTMQLLGVQGALPNIGENVRYHDEAIGKSVLANFLNLGTTSTSGGYALGGVLSEFFIMSLQGLAQLIADTATQHVVEDLVDVNFGTDVPAPRVVFDPIGQDPGAVVQAVQALIAAGAIFPDPQLDAFVRNLVGLPPKAPLPAATTPAGAAAPPPGTAGT
jgi:hypothetical protein